MYKYFPIALLLVTYAQGASRDYSSIRQKSSYAVEEMKHSESITGFQKSSKKIVVDNCGMAPLAKSSSPRPKISGGSEVWPEHSYPWNVHIKYFVSLRFGGTLISDEWVLSTARYIHKPDWQSDIGFDLLFGAQDLSYPEESQFYMFAKEYYVHKDFDASRQWKNDIVLIHLPEKIKFTDYIQPACLPAYSDPYLHEHDQVVVTGFGYQEEGFPMESITLNMVELPIISQATCTEHFGDKIYNGSICTSGDDYKGPCNDDWGYPMNYQPVKGGPVYIRGIVSYSDPHNCEANLPYMYTRISYFLDWISEISDIYIQP